MNSTGDARKLNGNQRSHTTLLRTMQASEQQGEGSTCVHEEPPSPHPPSYCHRAQHKLTLLEQGWPRDAECPGDGECPLSSGTPVSAFPSDAKEISQQGPTLQRVNPDTSAHEMFPDCQHTPEVLHAPWTPPSHGRRPRSPQTPA